MASQAIVTLLVFMLAVACGQADAPTPLPNTPTPFPTATPTPTPQPAMIDTGVTPEYCNPAELDKLQEYSKSPASPCLVRHPSISTPDVPTIVFLPSGKGQRRNAERMWDRYLSGADDVHSYRVVLPFEEDFEFIDDVRRTLAIMDEVFACYGGDRDRVHLAGVSTGGLAAFRLALGSPELFQTVLGAPGAFPTADLKDLARWGATIVGNSRVQRCRRAG